MDTALIIYKEYIDDKVNTIHYSVPITKLYLFDSEIINTHEGLGPIHFYAVSTDPDDVLDDEIIEAQEVANKIVKKYNQFIKNRTKIIFSDTDSLFYTKDNVVNHYVVKKIIYIHKK